MKSFFSLIFLCSFFFCTAQKECFLGLGGQNDENIADIFQLNSEQREKMINWSAELKIRNEILKDEAKFLLEKNISSSPDELRVMSYKYRILLDSMRQNVKMLDTKLLAIFNDNQYNLYIELCSGISLRPIYITRSVGEK